MPIQVQIPDGRILQFPDGMAREEMLQETRRFVDSLQATEKPGLIRKGLETVGDFGEAAVTGLAKAPLGVGQRITEAIEATSGATTPAGGISLALGFLADPAAVLSDPSLREELLKTNVGELRKSQAKAATFIEKQQKELAKTSPIAAPIGEITGQLSQLGAAGPAVTGLKSAVAVGGALGSAIGFATPTQELVEGGEQLIKSLGNAVKEGAIGAAAGGAFQQVLRGGGFAAKRVLQLLKRQKPESFSRAEKFLSDRISRQGARDVSKQIVAGDDEGLRIALAQAADNPEIIGAANVLARSGAGASIAKKNISETAKLLNDQESKLLAEIAPTIRTPQEGAEVLVDGVSAAKDSLIQARRLKAAPIYAAAYAKPVSQGTVDALLKRDVISAQVNKIRSEPKFQDIREDPLTSTRLWDEVKKSLDGMIDSAKRAGQSNDVRLFTKEKEFLKDRVIADNKVYGTALKTFESESQALNQIFGKGKKRTTLGKIADAADQDAVLAVERLHKSQPEIITKFKGQLESLGLEESFIAGAKSNMISLLEKGRVEGNLRNVLKTPLKRKQVSAAIGPERTKALELILGATDDFQKFKNALSGSVTAPLSVTERDIRIGGAPLISKALLTGFKAIGQVKQLFRGSDAELERAVTSLGNPQYIEELTKLLFDPIAGKEIANKIIKAKTTKARNRALGNSIKRIVDSITEPIADPLVRGFAVDGAIKD